MKSFFLFLFLCVCVYAPLCFAQKGLFKLHSVVSNVKVDVFHHSESGLSDHRVIVGPINYITDDSGGEGYFPDSVTDIFGRIKSVVYDFPINDAAYGIFADLKKEMTLKEVDIVFECSAEKCGDVAGWRLYYDSRIEGDVHSQYYLVGHYHGDKAESYISAYINEFTDRPRLTIKEVIIDTDPDKHIELVVNSLGRKLIREGSVSLDSYYFEFDSDRLNDQARLELDSIVGELQVDSFIRLVIEGHADEVGAEAYNDDLSRRRANEVFKYIVEQGVDQERLTVKAYGENVPVSIEDASKNRRVEIRKI